MYGKKQYLSYEALVIGNPQVGKSSFLQKYTQGTFSYEYTQNQDNKATFVEKDISKNILQIHLKIWEASSIEQLKNTPNFDLSKINCIALMYDVSDIQTYLNLDQILTEYKEYAQLKDVESIIIGSKYDKRREICVPELQIMKWMERRDVVKHFKISAPENVNVNNAVDEIINRCLPNRKQLRDFPLRNNKYYFKRRTVQKIKMLLFIFFIIGSYLIYKKFAKLLA